MENKLIPVRLVASHVPPVTPARAESAGHVLPAQKPTPPKRNVLPAVLMTVMTLPPELVWNALPIRLPG